MHVVVVPSDSLNGNVDRCRTGGEGACLFAAKRHVCVASA